MKTHRIFRTPKPTLKTLSEYGWILQPSDVWPRQWLDQCFDRAGVARPKAQIETNMLNLQPDLIAESGLLSFLPRLQLTPKGRLREVMVPAAVMSRRLELRYRDAAYHSPVVSRVIELLADAGRAIAEKAKKVQ